MRIQVQLDKRGEEIIAEIKQAAGRDDMSYRELFENAMAFLYWAVQQRQAGRTIASIDEKAENYREVTMPLFDRVNPKVKAAVAAAGP